MNDAQDCGEINAAMKRLPAFAAETANPARGRRDCEGNQENESGEADGNEWTLDDVFEHSCEIEGLIGAEIGEEVQADIGKSEQAEHTAEADEFGQVEEFAKRRDAKREDEEAESPIAGLMLEKFDGICGEVGVKAAPDKYE
jgi:hypothetical protein